MMSSQHATMSGAQFQHKWRGMTLKERSASQSHFNDLCHMLGVQTPTDADPNGDFYTFERGAEKTDGGAGWADVWLRSHFAREYKGHHADLRAAYRQLLQYREDLDNPPLLVVCDLDRFEVHTNFTGTAKRVHTFSLADLDEPENLATLRALWSDPARLRPNITVEAVTGEAAERFGELATSLQVRGITPRRTAHFLVNRDPVLEPMETIRPQDALLDLSDPDHPVASSGLHHREPAVSGWKQAAAGAWRRLPGSAVWRLSRPGAEVCRSGLLLH